MRNYLIFILLFLSIPAFSQSTNDAGINDLMAISDHYKSLNSLQMNIRYRAYGDTLEKNLLDSSTEKFISFNRRTLTSHLNTVSIVGDSLVFFIDHQRKSAYLDKKPFMNSGSDVIEKKLTSFFHQGKGYKRKDLGKGQINYRIYSDSILYDWIDVYIDINAKKLNRIVYKFSEESQRQGVVLMAIDFTRQLTGKNVEQKVFSLDKYVTFKESSQGKLLPAYQEYKFHSYVY